MEVRAAVDGDVPEIRLVAERAWSTDYPDIISRESVAAGVHEWYDAAMIGPAVDRADSVVLVADVDDAVVGFAHAVVSEDVGNILRLYVDPDHRGQGVGSELLSAVTDRLFERDVDRIRGMVLAANDLGNEFYDGHGFDRTSETHETEIGGEYYDERVWVLERDADRERAEAVESPASQ
jgi:ribosomal protein S18 acetylase RimI-like enzyme